MEQKSEEVVNQKKRDAILPHAPRSQTLCCACVDCRAAPQIDAYGTPPAVLYVADTANGVAVAGADCS